jgi:pimeloyl-ACP methyl ester carboxylesterase
MALIHHILAGEGDRPIVFVHGFGCDHTDWSAQVVHFSPHHQTVSVDLRGHGASPGAAAGCSIERYGADVAEVMRALSLPPAVLVGHSLGCRVVIEAALQAPEHTEAVILVDGSQFAPAMAAALREQFAAPDGYLTTIRSLFADMFTAKSDPAVVAAAAARAERLPRAIGEKMLLDLQRYDVFRLTASLASLRVPVLALQATYTNEKRERQSLHEAQTTPYLDMIRSTLPAARIDVVPDSGHFPQIDEAERTNALIGRFLADLPGR